MKKCFKFLIPLAVLLNITTSVRGELIQIINNDNIVEQSTDKLQKIKEKGILTVISSNTEPYSYKDPKTGAFRGVDADIIKELTKRLGIKNLDVRYITFSNALEELVKNPDIDLFGEGIFITNERKKLVDFTSPIYNGNEAILTRKDSGVKNKKDLKNSTIGVLQGTVYKTIVDNWKSQGELKDYITFSDNNSLIISLENKTINAIMTDSIIAENIVFMKPKSNFRVLSPSQYKPEIDLSVGYALKKEDTTLLVAIDEKLQEMKNDGTLYEILTKYALTGHYIP
ncbi:ABC transporter substrate-binding protein [Clostridium sp. SHJSY1]|uniref:substrate-binding periplasmic protein n=1 Tax=Clostridium sp. SHJSY1 TaxID=2942483 RepID=UPI0028740C21|nr:ABC transporter substrate-binding protein [Clostridium sp. SHJSY1]MDS0525021.1 ABC transporter substrate-binding protein [Clostridium sp. SHJSY1]